MEQLQRISSRVSLDFVGNRIEGGGRQVHALSDHTHLYACICIFCTHAAALLSPLVVFGKDSCDLICRTTYSNAILNMTTHYCIYHHTRLVETLMLEQNQCCFFSTK